jgi:hypothetical protein
MPLKKLKELAEKAQRKTLPIEFPESELILNEDGSVYHLNLLPKNISDTIITVGDPSRVYKVSEHFDEVEFEMNKREFITHTGTYKGKRLEYHSYRYFRRLATRHTAGQSFGFCKRGGAGYAHVFL